MPRQGLHRRWTPYLLGKSFTQRRMLQADFPTGTKWLGEVLRGGGRSRKDGEGDLSVVPPRLSALCTPGLSPCLLATRPLQSVGTSRPSSTPHTPGLANCQRLSKAAHQVLWRNQKFPSVLSIACSGAGPPPPTPISASEHWNHSHAPPPHKFLCEFILHTQKVSTVSTE